MGRWLPKWGFPFPTRDMLSFGGEISFILRVQTQTIATTTVEVTGMSKDGPFKFRFITGTDGSIEERDFPLPDIPVFASVRDVGEDTTQGELYARMLLVGNGNELTELGAGLVYNSRSVTWPFSNVTDQLPGHGHFKIVTSADPAAGAEATISVPQHKLWRVYSVEFDLQSDSNAATRRVHLIFGETGVNGINCFADTSQIVNELFHYSAAHFGGSIDAEHDDDKLIPIPNPLWLMSEEVIETETTAIQAGDNFTPLRVRVEEFPFLSP